MTTRIIASGVSTSAMLGLVAALAATSDDASAAATTPTVTEPLPPSTIVVVREIHRQVIVTVPPGQPLPDGVAPVGAPPDSPGGLPGEPGTGRRIATGTSPAPVDARTGGTASSPGGVSNGGAGTPAPSAAATPLPATPPTNPPTTAPPAPPAPPPAPTCSGTKCP